MIGLNRKTVMEQLKTTVEETEFFSEITLFSRKLVLLCLFYFVSFLN